MYLGLGHTGIKVVKTYEAKHISNTTMLEKYGLQKAFEGLINHGMAIQALAVDLTGLAMPCGSDIQGPSVDTILSMQLCATYQNFGDVFCFMCLNQLRNGVRCIPLGCNYSFIGRCSAINGLRVFQPIRTEIVLIIKTKLNN